MSETFIGMPGVVSNDSDATVHTGGWRTTVTIPEDTLRWGPTFPQGAHRTLANTQMRRNLGHATRTIRTKRGQRVAEMPDWEDLRDAAEAIKFEVESRLPELLEEFERNVTARGGIVHWARDKHEANRIIADIIKSKGVDEVVKIKSMATQETNLNEFLKDEGISARETDLAEMIVQLADDMPAWKTLPEIFPTIRKNSRPLPARIFVRSSFTQRLQFREQTWASQKPVLSRSSSPKVTAACA